MASNKRLRFAFAIATGPNFGLACTGWRVWTHNEDTYITAKPIGSMWKVSLHGDASWRLALTIENERSSNPMLANGHKTTPWEFEPTEFVAGRRLAFVIAATRAAFRPETVPTNESVIVVEDRWDRLPIAYVYMTAPGIDLRSAHPVVGGPLPLASGRQVWVTAGAEQVDPIQPQPVPPTTMLRPLTPAQDGVAAPGIIVDAVYVGDLDQATRPAEGPS